MAEKKESPPKHKITKLHEKELKKPFNNLIVNNRNKKFTVTKTTTLKMTIETIETKKTSAMLKNGKQFKRQLSFDAGEVERKSKQ